MAASRVLYIHSSPLIDLRNKPYITDVDVLNCSCEKKIIFDAIRDSDLSISFRSIIATVQNLSDAIIAGATMIHYAGHGERSAISFETKYAEIYAMDVKTLKSLLEASQTSSRTKIVVVSACHSEEAGKTFIEAGIPHVVAVRREHRLADKASHIFTKSFYNALLLSKSVQTAFDIAVSTVSAIHGSNCGDEFILLPLNGNHSECVFDSTSVGGIVSEQRVQTVNFCDCPPSNFIERCRVMQEMYRHFVDNHRCVTLHGLKGSGKTAIALRSAVFMAERDLFDFIFYVPFERSCYAADTTINKSSESKSGYINKSKDLTNENDRKDMDKMIKTIAASMREYGEKITSLDTLLDFLTTNRRVLFIFDGCDVFLSKKTGEVPLGLSSSPKPMSYKNVLQNNTNSTAPNLNGNNIGNNNGNNIGNQVQGPGQGPGQISCNNSYGHSTGSGCYNGSGSGSGHQNGNKTCYTLTGCDCFQDYNQSMTNPAFRELTDSMLRRSEDVSFLNLLSAKGPLLGLLSHEHEISVTLPPLSDYDSAEFLVKITSPKCLKLPATPSFLFPFSQMRFLCALQGNPRAIGTFALFLNNCHNANNPNLPVRDTDFWISSAVEIHRKVTTEQVEKESKEVEVRERSDRNDRKDIKEREREKEKEKEKVYDFNDTPGYEGKANKINFGLLSSQLPNTPSPSPSIDTPAPALISFLSSPPLPRPLPCLSLNRSQIVANTFLLGITSDSTISRDDLIAHIKLWAELTATREVPHTPRTYVAWNDFIGKFENLLFQTIFVQFQSQSDNWKLSNVLTRNLDGPEVLGPTHPECVKSCDVIENLKSNFERRFSISDIAFLKQKIKLETLGSASGVGNSNGLSKLPKSSVIGNDDSKAVICLPAYKTFLSWWLPLLFTLRKMRYEFCCVHAISPVAYGSEQCTLVQGFIGRESAVRLLESARESGVFLLRFSESKPGQIAISYTDYDGCENSELDSTLSEPNSLEEEFSDLNFDKKKFSLLENDNEKRKKMTVGHCLVDTVVDGLILRLANTVRKYDTLKQLLMDCKKLKFFYPHLPKAKGLECVDRFIEQLQNTVS